MTDDNHEGEGQTKPRVRYGSKQAQVNIWLEPDMLAEIDALCAAKTRDAVKVTRASLVRYWIERGLKEARRAR
jgi:hypothetical protein